MNDQVADDGIDVRTIVVGRQALRVATTRGPAGRPPLLLFNGIGANWQLAKPFIHALTDTAVIIFDVPGIGGSPLPALPYRPSTLARLGGGPRQAARASAGRRRGRLVGRRDRSAIRASARSHTAASWYWRRPRRARSWCPADYPCSEARDATALRRPELHAQHRRPKSMVGRSATTRSSSRRTRARCLARPTSVICTSSWR